MKQMNNSAPAWQLFKIKIYSKHFWRKKIKEEKMEKSLDSGKKSYGTETDTETWSWFRLPIPKPGFSRTLLIHDLLSKFLYHYFSLVPLFVFCTIICSILNFHSIFEIFLFFCKLEFSMSHIGNFTFKSEHSTFELGTFYFSNWNFLFFNKFVLNSPSFPVIIN